MDVKYKATCSDCGASSPEYDTEKFALHVLSLHRCEDACPECRFSPGQSDGRRGLCNGCYRNLKIREKYPRRKPSWLNLIEDLIFMDEAGIGIEEACKRLGKKRETVRRGLDRCNRLDLYWKMAKREPDYEFRQRCSRRKVVA